MKVLMFIFFLMFVADSVRTDTVMVDTARDYTAIQQKMFEQHARLDSIIFLLRNDTLTKEE